jgi:hypothetical protein
LRALIKAIKGVRKRIEKRKIGFERTRRWRNEERIEIWGEGRGGRERNNRCQVVGA